MASTAQRACSAHSCRNSYASSSSICRPSAIVGPIVCGVHPHESAQRTERRRGLPCMKRHLEGIRLTCMQITFRSPPSRCTRSFAVRASGTVQDADARRGACPSKGGRSAAVGGVLVSAELEVLGGRAMRRYGVATIQDVCTVSGSVSHRVCWCASTRAERPDGSGRIRRADVGCDRRGVAHRRGGHGQYACLRRTISNVPRSALAGDRTMSRNAASRASPRWHVRDRSPVAQQAARRRSRGGASGSKDWYVSKSLAISEPALNPTAKPMKRTSRMDPTTSTMCVPPELRDAVATKVTG